MNCFRSIKLSTGAFISVGIDNEVQLQLPLPGGYLRRDRKMGVKKWMAPDKDRGTESAARSTGRHGTAECLADELRALRLSA